jgi:hypothetical protein
MQFSGIYLFRIKLKSFKRHYDCFTDIGKIRKNAIISKYWFCVCKHNISGQSNNTWHFRGCVCVCVKKCRTDFCCLLKHIFETIFITVITNPVYNEQKSQVPSCSLYPSLTVIDCRRYCHNFLFVSTTTATT